MKGVGEFDTSAADQDAVMTMNVTMSTDDVSGNQEVGTMASSVFDEDDAGNGNHSNVSGKKMNSHHSSGPSSSNKDLLHNSGGTNVPVFHYSGNVAMVEVKPTTAVDTMMTDVEMDDMMI